MTCRTCQWLDVKPDALGRRVVRSDRMYQCLAPVGRIALPASITTVRGFTWLPVRRHMAGEDGEGCPLWNALPTKKDRRNN
jgi:hypothetical protein